MRLFRSKILLLLLWGALTLFIGVQIHTSLRHRIITLPRDADELAWFYHADFFRLLVQGNISDPYWQSLEAYDHPPLTKYIYGAYLQITSPQFTHDRTQFRRTYGSWYDGNIDIFPYDHPAFMQYVHNMRELNIVFALATLTVAALLLWHLTGNILLSLGFAGWLGHIGSLQVILIRAVSDVQYLLFFLCALLAFVLYLKKQHTWLLILSSALGALSFSSKLIGGIYFLIVPVFFLLETCIRKKQATQNFISVLIVMFVGGLLWVVLNPTLYPSPITNSLYYLKMRDSILLYQTHEPHNSPAILVSVSQRMGYLSCTFFHTPFHKPCADWYLFPLWYVNAALFLLGVYTLAIRTIKQKNRVALFALTALVVIIILSAWKLQFAWERYLVTHLSIVSAVTFLGIHAVFRTLKSQFSKHGKV
ncbi:hypothetical protein HZB58_05055 [Candidatus Gottesmanbacteria bacterium]|nr:hypothetical protein [Candidatus Gottesmanbacteria bacterium]